MWKTIKVFIAFCATSMFYFPFQFTFLPGRNVKMLMAAVGVVLCSIDFVRNHEAIVPKNLFPVFAWAGVVSLIGVFSMTYNGTIDDAYAGYIISMAVWLSAAYVAMSAIRWAQGKLSIEIVAYYLIAVCISQGIEALVIEYVPSVQAVVDAYINVDQPTLHRIHRLYGIGASLDVAGARFSPVLLLITHLAYNLDDDEPGYKVWIYVASFVAIVILGSIIARTTYVGAVLSAIYLFVHPKTWGTTITVKGISRFVTILGVAAITTIVVVYFYNHDSSFHYWFRFAFEGFFNYFERGEYYLASTNKLETMYVFPDNTKTWIIGDGYFSNPYWSDYTYTYIDQNIRGFYKETDVGYLRFIFYFGVIGLLSFMIFMFVVYRTCHNLMRKHSRLFFFVMLANFTIWLKVATDIFCFMAIFLCLGNMLVPEVPEEEIEECDSST